jgi:hypothetical protein
LYRRIHSTSWRFASNWPKPLAKSGILHSLVLCRTATGHVVVHQTSPGETAFDGNGAVGMRFHQALEDPVAEYEKFLAPVEPFSKANQ